MRILVTGSRDWTNESIIFRSLVPYAQDPEDFVTLVTGACRTGADPIAELIGKNFGWNIERHPANWKKYGRRAGPVRNAEMVGLGADVCLAFVLNSSRGATGCSDLAKAEDIPTVVHHLRSVKALNKQVSYVYKKVS